MMALTGSHRDNIFEVISDGSIGQLEALVAAGASPKSCDQNGLPAVFHAAVLGRCTMLSFLLDNGADMKSKDAAGLTLRDIAVLYGNDRLLQLLREKEANANRGKIT